MWHGPRSGPARATGPRATGPGATGTGATGTGATGTGATGTGATGPGQAAPGTAASPGGPGGADNGVGGIEQRTDGTTGTTAAGGQGSDQRPAPPGAQVPGWLQRAAGWCWRLLLVGIVVYLAFRVASMLKLVVLPCVAALLLTALLQPVQARLRQTGLPALAATWCTLL